MRDIYRYGEKRWGENEINRKKELERESEREAERARKRVRRDREREREEESVWEREKERENWKKIFKNRSTNSAVFCALQWMPFKPTPIVPYPSMELKPTFLH